MPPSALGFLVASQLLPGVMYSGDLDYGFAPGVIALEQKRPHRQSAWK